MSDTCNNCFMLCRNTKCVIELRAENAQLKTDIEESEHILSVLYLIGKQIDNDSIDPVIDVLDMDVKAELGINPHSALMPSVLVDAARLFEKRLQRALDSEALNNVVIKEGTVAELTEDRKTQMRDGELMSMGVATCEKIFAGSLVARDDGGFAVSGRRGVGLLGMGRAEGQVDNTDGADGAESVAIRKGCFCFANDGTITMENVGENCNMVDDQTVSIALTVGGVDLSVAGRIFDVDSDGVWVTIR